MRNLRVIIVSSLALAVLLAALATTLVSAAPGSRATTTLVRGTFTDSAKYTGTGSVKVTKKGAVRTIRIGRDFRADPGSIRLRLYLATDATGRDHIDLGPMAETGAQNFRVPARTSLSRYRFVIAWCAAVDEPITQARLIPVRRA